MKKADSWSDYTMRFTKESRGGDYTYDYELELILDGKVVYYKKRTHRLDKRLPEAGVLQEMKEDLIEQYENSVDTANSAVYKEGVTYTI